MKIKFLGSASNGGVPQLDCRCAHCQAARKDSRLTRMRSCLAVSETDNEWSVLDCGPDFNRQILEQNWLIQDIKSIALTHLHPDHSIGLSELGFGKVHQVKIVAPVGLQKEIIINNMFAHLFNIGFVKFSQSKLFKFVPIDHWPNHNCFAIVFGKNKKILFAPDCAKIDNNLFMEMGKVDLIIFDGTFLNKSKFNHISIKESCPILSKLKKPVIFTHINHSENVGEITKFVEKFKFKIAKDDMKVNI